MFLFFAVAKGVKQRQYHARRRRTARAWVDYTLYTINLHMFFYYWAELTELDTMCNLNQLNREPPLDTLYYEWLIIIIHVFPRTYLPPAKAFTPFDNVY